jgi:hypothetical protein
MLRTVAPQFVEETLELGSVTFLHRPRVEQRHTDDLRDVQRLLVLLAPQNRELQRLIVIGRKRLPRSAKRDRFWGFVDLALTPNDMASALSAQIYGTKRLGLRQLPAPQPFAYGTYSLTTHGSHSHLRWHVDRVEARDPIAFEVDVEGEADYIVTIANPDLSAWGLVEPADLQESLFDELELHVTIPSAFPAHLQQRFGANRFTQLDSTEWLDHPGAEMVFDG